MTHTLWIVCVFLITAAEAQCDHCSAEDIPCPEGGRIHLSSLRCYWLSEAESSWSKAQDSCRESAQEGDLASAHSLELQNFIRHSFPVKTTVWVWLKGLGQGGSDQAGVVESSSPALWAGSSEGGGGCTQMALGTLGQWRRAQCSGQYVFLCEKDLTETLPPIDGYLTGLPLMTGMYIQTQINPLLSVPDIGQHTVEMQLFPGLWFSHAGQLVKVDLVVRPSTLSSLARVQILRPYCDPNHHLVPPGGCSMGQYWCHLLEACVPTTSPCSPYDSAAEFRGFALPPRYLENSPYYHMVADLPLRINPSSEPEIMSLLLSDHEIMVYPDDIVAIQHTRDSGTFLHCFNREASINSPWRQSYLSLRGAEWEGWWKGSLISLSQGGQWVDGVVCDLRMLYVDNLHRGTKHVDVFGFTHTVQTTVPDVRALTTGPFPNLGSKFRLHLIHPRPDKKNQIHVQINSPTLIVVKVFSGETARSSWSAPVLQSGVPFSPSCPEEVIQFWPGCNTQFSEAWFSSVTLVSPSVGVQTMNISVSDAMSSESVSVKVCSYEAVTRLSVEPHGLWRMLVDMSQSFAAKVESGSSVKFTWVIDNLEKFAYEGETYSVLFKKPAEYKLKVTASNPVSSLSQLIVLTVDESIPLAEPEFLFVKEVVAVNCTHLYTLRVKVDVSLPVTFRWDFGDGSANVIHTHSAPCQTMVGLKDRRVKQVYVQDSVNYTFSLPDDYILYVKVVNQNDNTDASVKINVRPHLSHLHISSDPLVPFIKQALLLEAATEPSTYSVLYTWDFGDGSKAVQGVNHRVSHAFGCAGVYNITVCANNTLTALTTWFMVEVMEKISGLTISHNGPSELSSATNFRAKVATGTSLVWNFDFGDGSLQKNHTYGSISHIYKSPGNFTVDVTVSNSVSKARQSITVEVYRLAVSGVLPTQCVINGKDIQLTVVVNGNISILTFHWQFGDGSPLIVVTGQSTILHPFPSQGVFHVSLTVLSSITSVSFNTSICVEASITNVMVKPSQDVVAVGDEVCFKVLISPQQMTGYQFKWFGNYTSLPGVTENSQKCFVFKHEGVEEVSVLASNNVSNKTAKASITVQKPVSMLSVVHDSQSDTLTVNTVVSFWVTNCTGSNVSMLWDFGDGSPVEHKHNVSHVFTLKGQFTVTATAFNTVSRDSVNLKVNVVVPVSDLSLRTNQPYAAVGEETVITAFSSAVSSNIYYWTVDSMSSTKQGTCQFRFIFPKPGVYQVRVTTQNMGTITEAAILIEAFERIEGLHIECQSITNMKYVPTQEELLFIPLIAKGSNVSYHWFAAQYRLKQQVTGDREVFYMVAKTPGRISVQLRASNKLGEATSTVSLVAVERVTSAHIKTQSNNVALGKSVNISVSVLTGSDLQYLWYRDVDPSPLQTQVPFLLHTFTSLGLCLVKVSVQNILSHSNDTKLFVVQEEIQEVDFQIEGGTYPFYVNTSAAVQLCGTIRKGSGVFWNWKIRSPTGSFFSANNKTFNYTFLHAGTYQVSLNVSSRINWQVVSHSVMVQDRIEGLRLKISKSFLCAQEKVTFIPTISKGSNVSFFITFRNNDWIHSQDILERKYTTSCLPIGRHLVRVKAWNQVSSTEVSSNILVLEDIHGLRFVNCCSTALEALKEFQFKAEVQRESPMNYTWMFHMAGSEPTWLMGQEVVFVPAGSGLLSVSVVASNGVCSRMLNETATVEWPVNMVKLVCFSERIFVGHTVSFSATVNGGSNPRYLWDFGDSTEVLVTESSAVNHKYYTSGIYSVMVKVVNSVSHVSTKLHIKVEELQCSSPQATLIQSQSTILRSRPSFFEASMIINCTAYRTMYLWEIFSESNCISGNTDSSGNRVILSAQVDKTSTLLLLPKNALDVGQYCLVFTVSLYGSPLFVQRKTNVTVVHSPLVAIIKGGSHRLWSCLSDLILDGSESQDPDVEIGVEDTLQYHWSFFILNSTNTHFLQQPTGSDSITMTVLSTQLQANSVYVFTLTVHKTGRRPASVNQTARVEEVQKSFTVLKYKYQYNNMKVLYKVTVSQASVLPVSVDCVSCAVLSSPYHTSYTNPIILAGHCGQGGDHTLQYKWSAESQTGIILDLDEVSTSTGRHSPNLVVRSGVLHPGLSYTFTLNVSQPGRGQRGFACITILPNNPPHGGLCDLSPESDIRLLETLVTYSCSGNTVALAKVSSNPIYINIFVSLNGEKQHIHLSSSTIDKIALRKSQGSDTVIVSYWWQTDERETSQLIYTLQVEPCQTISTVCPSLILYRGTRAIFSSFVPMGSQSKGKGISVITVTVLVEDHLGTKVIALNRTLAVENPARDKVASDWLISKSRKELWGLVQHGNLHEIIPYSIALASQLNQMESRQMASRLIGRREIRENVTRALASLPMSSLLDVDQISSALAQSTAFPSELVCKNCQKEILKAVGKMINVMEGHMIPGILSATDTGRNIFNIIGNTLAAVSEAVSASGSHPSSSSLLQSASQVTLSALGHASALMRSLMRSHVHKEAPLLLSTPYISTAGYRGNPSDLLCSHQSNLSQTSSTDRSKSSLSCQFHVPNSLIAHLKSQRSEVVQVLFGMDRALESSHLLPASNPPISTSLVSMELSTPEGQPILIQDLDLKQAIRIDLPNKYPVDHGGENGSAIKAGNGTCLTVTLPTEGWLHFTIKTLENLDENAGLYLSFNFSLGPGTTAHVGISLYGENKSGPRHLQRDGAFQRGSLDQFHVETDDNLGEVWKIRIWHDNTGLDPSWYVQHVVVWDPQTDHMFFFLLDDWLSVENQSNGTVEKEVLASCNAAEQTFNSGPEEISQFQRVLVSQLIFGMMERHVWVSLWERPAHSRFTRAQRVTCIALMLHLYFALGALWFGAVGSKGHSGPVSAHLLVNVETVAVGVTLALLVFPVQCFLSFLFRKAHSQQMESRVFDSSILDFWAVSGLAPQADRVCHDTGVVVWPSCYSLLDLPVGPCLTKMTPAHDLSKASAVLGPTRPLRRKKALKQLCLASPSSPDMTPTPVPSPHIYYLSRESSGSNYSHIAPVQEVLTMKGNPVHNHNLKTFLTLSEEDLMMSIAAAEEDPADLTKSSSDSGRDSPRTTSSLSTTWSTSYSSWSDQSEDKFLCGADIHKPDSQSCPSMYEPRLYKCPSVLSVDSVASTFLPSPSPDSTHSSSSTRIGVARGPPSWLLPPWALCVIYPLVAVMLGGCLAVVCVQALIYTTLWRPVDPEVEEQLARETTVVRAFGEHCSRVRPPCGYGLLQAKEEARKIQALRSLMRVVLLISGLLVLFGELWSMATERAQYLGQCRHWFQLLLALLSLGTAFLHFSFLSLASSCVSKGFPYGTEVFSVLSCPANCACSKAAGNLKVRAKVGGDRPSDAESLEGAVGSDYPAVIAAAALHSPRKCAFFTFSGRFPVCTSGRCVSPVNPAWPNGSSKAMQDPPSPGSPLWSTVNGGKSLSLGQTLWSYSP
ncbi:Polycystin-1 Autosomal dominant polycystic kidney disease 1 protein -like protein Precursor [Channa argus]|uniref:Polycystin-1 Autosomal dominant polycystic kidney disease 1 protein-like protein n=1 Tax=Channa argus TaxID=215402 RepID=A0A6G1QQG0_CHAAH|nr:Polycystin-1 Autosomal dominant polycystic kidney disease 1 protein -like protein Precursor [Channa argus]